MKILATICARGGSKGVPRKALRRLRGLSLTARAIECAQRVAHVTDIVVSTDDREIAEVAREYGIPYMMRPAELATDTASKWDVFRHIVERIPCDMLIDLDVGCPFREPADVTACIEKLLHGQADVVVTAYESERNPYFNMVYVGGDNRADIVMSSWVTGRNISSRPITRRQDAPQVWSLSPAVFAIRRKTLDRYDHWSQSHLEIHILPRSRALDIDTEDDWSYAEWLMSRKDKE